MMQTRILPNDPKQDECSGSGQMMLFRLSGSGLMMGIRVRQTDEDPDPAKCCGSLSGKFMMIWTQPNVADLNPQNLLKFKQGVAPQLFN
jgi:hypothetical protein